MTSKKAKAGHKDSRSYEQHDQFENHGQRKKLMTGLAAIPSPAASEVIKREDIRVNYWPLIGVAVVIVGFALKRNPVLVVIAAGVASALAAGMGFDDLLALIGIAKPLFHLTTKRIEYWTGLTINVRTIIIAWHDKGRDRFKNL